MPLEPEAGAPVVTIGRSSPCDVVLSNLTVSRVHAQLGARAGRWVVRDLGSTNGTRVNGRAVSDGEVRHGDVLRLGAPCGS